MARRSARSPLEMETYWTLTKRPLLCLWFILLPLLAYHVNALIRPTTLRAPNDLLRFLAWFGAASAVLPPLLVIVVLVVQAYRRRDSFEFRPGVLALMAAESLLWASPLMILGHFGPADNSLRGASLLSAALESVGAGVYEEFLFRMVFLTAFAAFCVDLLKGRRDLFVSIGVVVGAVLFALYHFLPDAPQPFTWQKFFFLASAGALWGIAYVTRGFGVAVGAHIAWNLYWFVRMAF
ncbi:MAG: CPBP family intramembrane metalloprotease [Planctomycetota bacterium]|nr:CPBP family intramembrane metalloprotease [Planctomycetota bacterium]